MQVSRWYSGWLFRSIPMKEKMFYITSLIHSHSERGGGETPFGESPRTPAQSWGFPIFKPASQPASSHPSLREMLPAASIRLVASGSTVSAGFEMDSLKMRKTHAKANCSSIIISFRRFQSNSLSREYPSLCVLNTHTRTYTHNAPQMCVTTSFFKKNK